MKPLKLKVPHLHPWNIKPSPHPPHRSTQSITHESYQTQIPSKTGNWHLLSSLPALGLKCPGADATNLITEMEEGWWKRMIHLLGLSKKRYIRLFHHPSSIFLISPESHMPGGQTGEASEFAKVRTPTGFLGHISTPDFTVLPTMTIKCVWPYEMAT